MIRSLLFHRYFYPARYFRLWMRLRQATELFKYEDSLVACNTASPDRIDSRRGGGGWVQRQDDADAAFPLKDWNESGGKGERKIFRWSCGVYLGYRETSVGREVIRNKCNCFRSVLFIAMLFNILVSKAYLWNLFLHSNRLVFRLNGS